MSKQKFYITTPIYYVNDIPHIGHAYTTVAADVLARYHRSKGDDVFFLTGTDEHGAKIAEAAAKKGQTPLEFVDQLIPRFQKAWNDLNISYDQFIRTTNPEHEKTVQEIVKTLQANGYIEKRKYEGLYCVGCEKFYAPDELVDGCCPDHKRKPELHSEENYFFLLSKVAKDFDLISKIENDEIKISPESRKNEILGKIKTGLEDVSISREKVEWGINFPGDENQTIYVWIDALINYFTATKIYDNSPGWPADLHLMAKDILWFHAVIWPAVLLAVGEELPKQVFAHGYFTIDGQKMSKSIGNVIDPISEIEKYGNPDVLRYALLREFPFGEDGDISEAKIASRYSVDLGNNLGNLVQRTLSMINRYEINVSRATCENIDISKELESLRFDHALEKIWQKIREQNAIIDQEKPWELAKNDTEKLTIVVDKIYNNLLIIADALTPFMPETSEKMKKQLIELKPEPLFPRLEN